MPDQSPVTDCSTDTFEIWWNDAGREAPAFEPVDDLQGTIIDHVKYESTKSCTIGLPYPASRCGFYALRCKRCGRSAIATTTGRANDPVSVILPCKEKLNGR